MPTGYTNILDRTGDEVDWLKRVLVRAFGLTYELRESNLNSTFEQIDKAIRTPSDIEYYETRLKEKEDLLKNLSIDDVSRKLYNNYRREAITYNIRARSKARKIKQSHERAFEFLTLALKLPDVSVFTKDIADFGRKQLELVKHDTEPCEIDVQQSFEAWLIKEKEQCEKDIIYYQENKTECKYSDLRRVEIWERFLEDVALLEKEWTKVKDGR